MNKWKNMEGDDMDEDWKEALRKLGAKETRTGGFTIFELKGEIPKSFHPMLRIEEGERIFRVHIWETVRRPTIIKLLSKVGGEGFIIPVLVIQTLNKKDAFSCTKKMDRAEFEGLVETVRKFPFVLPQTEDYRDFSICKDADEVIERMKKWGKVS